MYIKKSMSLAHGTRAHGPRGPGLSLLDETGEIVPAVREIVDLVERNDAALATGHVSPLEIAALHRYVRDEAPRTRLLIDHVLFTVPSLTADQLEPLVDAWTWFELSYYSVSSLGNGTTPDHAARMLGSFPDAQWIMVSDTGQPGNPLSPRAFAWYCQALADEGVGDEVLSRMVHQHPRELLGV